MRKVSVYIRYRFIINEVITGTNKKGGDLGDR